MDDARRRLIVCGCHIIGLPALATLFEGCGGDAGTSPSSSPGGGSPIAPLTRLIGAAAGDAVTIPIESNGPAGAVGGAVLIQSAAGDFLAARSAPDTFVAVTAICTHEGCTINGRENGIYACPCHGSRFATSGAVVQGPAGQPLRRFETRFDGSLLTIVLG